MKSHTKCLNNTYPASQVQRQNVPVDKIAWSTDFPTYNPPTHTNPLVHGKPWADPDLLETTTTTPPLQWNKMDEMANVDRSSYQGEYDVVECLPRNPIGRTGLRGRGLLGRWGPNHAADPIVTRWLRDGRGEKVIDSSSGKARLQFVAIQRKDSGEWAVPGGMVDPGEHVSQTLKREFAEEALDGGEVGDEERLAQAFKDGVEIYKGYVDDPRNTDNAWMETVAYNYHDENGRLFNFRYIAGSDASNVRWMNIDSDIRLYASHQDFMKDVASLRDAHW